ncbi:MAG TPA: helix-turn-helix domain-containing protein [Bacilli bacterium]|nr:helix-turn-helix domain-containing protein [Bacilli bacterium]
MNQEKIGKFISKLRKEKNMTQEQLAEKLNVSNKSVSRWENGKTLPDYSIMIYLCETLDVSLNELIKGNRLTDKDFKNEAENNLKEVLKDVDNKNKKFENKMLGILMFNTLIAMFIINILPLNSIKNIIIFILVIVMVFISNTLNIISIFLYKDKSR